MVTPTGRRSREWLPPWWIEVILVGAGYVCYQVIQVLVSGSSASAIERARELWRLQGLVHLTPESWLNSVVSTSPPLVVATGLYYGIAHFAVTPAVLVWLRVRRPDVYPALRNTLLVTSMVALLIYWLLPLAPPRLSIATIVDTLKQGNILSAADPAGPASLANQYAAMPSLHVAWATWVALAIVIALPSVQARHVAWAYPAITTIVVLATGNHFVADAVAGALLVAGAWWLCRPRRKSAGNATSAGHLAPTFPARR